MARLGICHRAIHTIQRPQNKTFLLRKPFPTGSASFGERLHASRNGRKFGVSFSAVKFWDRTENATSRFCTAQLLDSAWRGWGIRRHERPTFVKELHAPSSFPVDGW